MRNPIPSWWCFIVGHQAPTVNSYAGARYARIKHLTIDGINRVHAQVYGDCPRCSKNYHICSVHIPTDEVVKIINYEN